ncbi:MAG TPA: multicopper oxidase domain-containing protein [Tahibacter sp.]|uniref:multicopper oxidase family protein n=1 Tax=Tahibacter sp. TaxID=2056211 RepID=UPI002BA6C138|nr:multicopper oxidase domain-containing protein [Tahibacter sp.]HSX62769.1 multicopper oxidase domain-containing protein [Tahibacter sp.]
MTSSSAFDARRSAARVKPVVCAAVPLLLLSAAALAQAAERVDAPPVPAAIARSAELLRKGAAEAAPGLQGRRLPAVAPHEAKLALDIDYTESTIYNPATGRNDRVKLRSYRSPGTKPKVPFVAPLIEIQPGETVRIALDNQLPPEPDCAKSVSNINIPHCFNSTNLHSHGLWVSPAGNSDNVLIALLPGVKFEYEYNIPPDHPSGTFWYHPHMHGSTALQVASGMAGTLIVRGSRRPTDAHTGDIDTLLMENGQRVTERVVQLQQVQYACRDKDGNIKKKTVKKDGKDVVVAWVCDENDVGEVSRYDQFGQTTWSESGRYTSVNGQVLPTFEGGRAGAVERWRAVHAGVRNSVNLQFRKMKSAAKAFDRLEVGEQQSWIDANCTGPLLPQFEIASDGLTHTRAIRKTANILQPGYRSDVLVVFPEEGEYCVIDGDASADTSVSWTAESRQLLGKVSVGKGETVSGDAQAHLIKALSTMADATQEADIAATIKTDLAAGFGLQSFVPHPDVTASELTRPAPDEPSQKMEFSIKTVDIPDPADPTKTIKETRFQVDNNPYDPKTARTLVLGRSEEWLLTSISGSHPFHIHVNPFQIDRILDANDKDVSVPGSGDTSYDGLKGTWKDTLWVKNGFRLYVRTRYERYIGEYVLHCHILDHEDQGMMQNVRVVLPDGKGGGVYGHH